MLKQLGLSSFFKSNQQPQVDSDSSFSEDSGTDKEREQTQWTRVKSIHSMRTINIQLFDLNKDLAADSVKNQARQHLNNQPEQCLFDPDKYGKQGYDFSLAKHELSEEELVVYGKMATNIRKHFELDTSAPEEVKDNTQGSLPPQLLQRSMNLQRRLTRFQ